MLGFSELVYLRYVTCNNHVCMYDVCMYVCIVTCIVCRPMCMYFTAVLGLRQAKLYRRYSIKNSYCVASSRLELEISE